MKEVILRGKNLIPENVKKEIQRRATKNMQGSYAAIKYKGRGKRKTTRAFLLIDNGNILFKHTKGLQNFVCEKFSLVAFS